MYRYISHVIATSVQTIQEFQYVMSVKTVRGSRFLGYNQGDDPVEAAATFCRRVGVMSKSLLEQIVNSLETLSKTRDGSSAAPSSTSASGSWDLNSGTTKAAPTRGGTVSAPAAEDSGSLTSQANHRSASDEIERAGKWRMQRKQQEEEARRVLREKKEQQQRVLQSIQDDKERRKGGSTTTETSSAPTITPAQLIGGTFFAVDFFCPTFRC